MKVTVKACAKINLFLDIVGKRNDNYHLVDMVMQSITLHDTVVLSTLNSKNFEIKLSCNVDSLPTDSSNLAYRAAQLFFDATKISPQAISIKIKKKIPMQAGLAGGSADAAAVLVGLNHIFKTGLDMYELCEIGEKLGADVPFCIQGGTMLGEGTGTILSPLPNMPECFIVVAKPDLSVCTAKAYADFDELEEFKHPDLQKMSNAVCESDLKKIARRLNNVFEYVVDETVISPIKEAMMKCGALGACMTGSGSSVFGLFEDKLSADDAVGELNSKVPFVTVCQPSSSGCIVDD